MTTRSVEEFEVRSPYGALLPSISEQRRWYDEAVSDPVVGSLGRLFLNAARMSEKTGCLVLPERARSEGGYCRTAVRQVVNAGIASSSTGAHRAAHFLVPPLESGQGRLFIPGEELRHHVDHVCRNTACCHGNHMQLASNELNNELKIMARGLENTMLSGQVFSPVGLDWLESLVSTEPERLATTTITTRYGAFRLRQLEEDERLLYAEQVFCEVLDALKPPTAYRKRRRKVVAPIIGQLLLDQEQN